MHRALKRQDIQVLFSVLPGGASLYLGFMAHEGNCRSLSLHKLFGSLLALSQRGMLVLWTFFPEAQCLESWERKENTGMRKKNAGMRKKNASLILVGEIRTPPFAQVFVCGFPSQPRLMGLCLAVLLPTSILTATHGDEIHPVTCPSLLQGGIQGQMQLRGIPAGHHPLHSLSLSAPN